MAAQLTAKCRRNAQDFFLPCGTNLELKNQIIGLTVTRVSLLQNHTGIIASQITAIVCGLFCRAQIKKNLRSENQEQVI